MKEEDLERLIGKYYSGTGTEEEERSLRAFFAENDAPPGYEAEKAIFSFYLEEGEIPEPSAGFEKRIKEAVGTDARQEVPAGYRRLLVPLLSAAAGLLILVGSYFFLARGTGIRDTYSDPRIAYAETIRILTEVSSKMNQGTGPLKTVGKINEVREKGLGSISRSATLVEKNLKSLGYLRNSDGLKKNSKEKEIK